MLSIHHISDSSKFTQNVTLIANTIRTCWELRVSGRDACCVQLDENENVNQKYEYINQTLKLLFKQIA